MPSKKSNGLVFICVAWDVLDVVMKVILHYRNDQKCFFFKVGKYVVSSFVFLAFLGISGSQWKEWGGGGLYRNAAAISSGANAQSVPAAKEKSLPACDERYRKKERKKERKGTKRKATRPSETHRRSSQPQSGQSRRLSGNQSRNRSIRLLTLSLSLSALLSFFPFVFFFFFFFFGRIYRLLLLLFQ